MSLIAFVVAFLLYSNYKNLGLKSKERVILITEKEVFSQLKELELRLQKDFKDAQDLSDSYANIISNYPDSAIVLARSFPELFDTYNFSAIGIHPSQNYSRTLIKYNQKFSYGDRHKLWSPFYKKGQKRVVTFPYDYIDLDGAGKFWYSEKIEKGSWTAPYLGAANNELVISYRSPIIINDNAEGNDGIVCLDYALGYIQKEVAKLNLYRKGYGVIVNEDSIIVSHPSSKFLGENLSEAFLKTEIEKIAQLPEATFKPIHEYNDRIIDRDLYYKYSLKITEGNNPIVYKAIIILKESETLAAFNTEDLNPTQRVKSLRIEILCCLTVVFSLIVFWVFVLFDLKRVWLLIALQSFVYIAGTLTVIYFQLKTPLYSFSNTDTEITNTTELDACLNALKREQQERHLSPIKVGIFMQNVKFSSANDLHVTGYLWQKARPSNLHFKVSEEESLASVVQPDFPEAESVEIELINEKEGLILWYFSAKIRQSFDYSDYPFDEEDIWIKVRPKKVYQDRLIYVPDFDSYLPFVSQNDYYLDSQIKREALRNGLADNLFIEGWDVIKTFFSIRDRVYTTSFGEFDLKKKYTYPELHFNISVERRFLEVFVVYFIPILVTAFLLFTVLMTYTMNSVRNEFYGFNVSTVLAFCASLFFVIIVSHMSLRETLQTGNIIYLEYFFFCLYFLITLVSIGAFFFSSPSPSLFKRNNGEFIKMIYWPLFCFLIFLLTTFHFSIF